jgi:hypothetical protein
MHVAGFHQPHARFRDVHEAPGHVWSGRRRDGIPRRLHPVSLVLGSGLTPKDKVRLDQRHRIAAAFVLFRAPPPVAVALGIFGVVGAIGLLRLARRDAAR